MDVMQTLIRKGKVTGPAEFPIWSGGDPPTQLKPDWLGIIHVVEPKAGRDDATDEYVVEIFMADGHPLGPTASSFDTLQAALDDGASLGVEEWEECSIPVER